MFVYGDVVIFKIGRYWPWKTVTVSSHLHMPVRPTLLHRMALVSFLRFRKNLGNLREFFWQMVYRPPGKKKLPVRQWESEGENPAIFCCTGSRVRFEETIHRTWNVLTGIRFMTPIRSCTVESTDNRPRDLYWCSSLGMFLVSFLYERRFLRIELLKIKCSLNVPFNIWLLYLLNR